MTRFLLAYLGALLAYGVLDLAFLGLFAKDFYRAQLGPLLLPAPNLGAAALLYLAYPAGVVFFTVLPALESGSVLRALALGAILGLLVYATFDLTNLALVKGWSASVAVVDVAWGALVTAASAAAGYVLARLAA